MYAQAVRTPPRFWHRGGRRIQSSASEQCAKGCAFPDVPLDCIKYLKLVDPACGSGNFLTESYLSLRRLENKVIRALLDSRTARTKKEQMKITAGQIALGGSVALNPIRVSISQFYGILDARALYPDAGLADLYDELTMPPELRKAHQQNDRAVIDAYGLPVRTTTESSCVAHLMKLYQELTAK